VFPIEPALAPGRHRVRLRLIDVHELANVVATMAPDYREAAAYLLAKVSFANLCAFVHSNPPFHAVARPCTIDSILDASEGITPDAARARETLCLLEASTVATGGREFLDSNAATLLRSMNDALERSWPAEPAPCCGEKRSAACQNVRAEPE
jgi:hypothetical protein